MKQIRILHGRDFVWILLWRWISTRLPATGALVNLGWYHRREGISQFNWWCDNINIRQRQFASISAQLLVQKWICRNQVWDWIKIGLRMSSRGGNCGSKPGCWGGGYPYSLGFNTAETPHYKNFGRSFQLWLFGPSQSFIPSISDQSSLATVLSVRLKNYGLEFTEVVGEFNLPEVRLDLFEVRKVAEAVDVIIIKCWTESKTV